MPRSARAAAGRRPWTRTAAGARWLALDLNKGLATWRRARFDPRPAPECVRTLGLVEGEGSARDIAIYRWRSGSPVERHGAAPFASMRQRAPRAQAPRVVRATIHRREAVWLPRWSGSASRARELPFWGAPRRVQFGDLACGTATLVGDTDDSQQGFGYRISMPTVRPRRPESMCSLSRPSASFPVRRGRDQR